MKTKTKLVKVTLEFSDGHKLVRTKEDALPFLIRLVKEINKN